MEKIIYPTKEKVYLVGTHHYCFRAGEPAEVIGVIMGKPSADAEPRLAYEVEYSDGITDLVPVSEIGLNYQIITFAEVRSGKFNKK